VTGASRVVSVAPERLAGWLQRFGARHGGLSWHGDEQPVAVTAPDGARAELQLPHPGEGPSTIDQLLSAAESFRDFGIVLVRRGGLAVGLVQDARLRESRCGTRYVQGQTKAGGWSQQRYARRRANQADELVGAAAQAVSDVLGAALRDPALRLVGGGDRRLVRSCLELVGSGMEERVLPHWLDVPDPRRRVLEEAVDRARSVRVVLNAQA